ncbi:MAG: succinyldiaminopimelate transaminase [Gammaproteobacteria bacterium]|nr:succinyldiaminopimelate transaminase [Gammaproteobacteria bacterium]NND60672.1 succinyldiaminopimelate transaminase [Gammaproteobacteria bacterium]
MNTDLARLRPYPFERLRDLLAGTTPPAGVAPINLAMGEPRHPPADSIITAFDQLESDLAHYPATIGSAALRSSCARYLERRFDLGGIDPQSMVLPLNGTREGLFAVAQALIDRKQQASVMLPNPFYQIYEGAALLAGAEPDYLAVDESGQIDIDAVSRERWQRCQLLYLCSPHNPTGAVLGQQALERLVKLAQRYDFTIVADECYSDIYTGAPPPGLLAACDALGIDRFRHCLVFHSLSKRASVPGLRSGFVAGDPQLIGAFRLYRSYHGCAMPPAHQRASIVAWDDDRYARENRQRYTEKFAAVLAILRSRLGIETPAGGFYLWLPIGTDDEDFARRLYAEHALTVLPGRYLGRRANGHNPGAGHIRVALVAPLPDCIEAAKRIDSLLENTL